MTASTPDLAGAAPSSDASALLQLMWLASPALPVGAFSYSEALEAAIDAGCVSNQTQVGDWLLDQLQLSLARCDLALVAQALGAWRHDDHAQIAELNAWVVQTRESSELRRQSEQLGRSMFEWLKNRHGSADAQVRALGALDPAPCWPVAFALAASRIDASPRDVLASFAFGWAENMTQAALKAVPLGQGAGQRVLGRLVAALPAALEHALGLAGAERQAYAPMLAILSARHETQYSRLFRS